VKKARESIQSGAWEGADIAVRRATRALDKAAQKGIIHKKNAARRKSRLVRYYNQALAAAGE